MAPGFVITICCGLIKFGTIKMRAARRAFQREHSKRSAFCALHELKSRVIIVDFSALSNCDDNRQAEAATGERRAPKTSAVCVLPGESELLERKRPGQR
jgi:hypothetical protein